MSSEDRMPPQTRDEVTTQDQPLFDNLTNLATGLFGDPKSSPFVFSRPSDGALVGPFPFFFAAPGAGEKLLGLVAELGKIPGLPADAKETVILTVGAHYQAPYELYAHTNVAKKIAGMDAGVVDAIASGKKPEGLNEACSTAYDVAKHLAAMPGPLPRQLWDRSIKTFGKDGTVALVHYVGAYAWTCIILNAMDAPVPE